jgi:hypothetical protein
VRVLTLISSLVVCLLCSQLAFAELVRMDVIAVNKQTLQTDLATYQQNGIISSDEATEILQRVKAYKSPLWKRAGKGLVITALPVATFFGAFPALYHSLPYFKPDIEQDKRKSTAMLFGQTVGIISSVSVGAILKKILYPAKDNVLRFRLVPIAASDKRSISNI